MISLYCRQQTRGHFTAARLVVNHTLQCQAYTITWRCVIRLVNNIRYTTSSNTRVTCHVVFVQVLVCRTCGRHYHSRSGLSNHELRCALVSCMLYIHIDVVIFDDLIFCGGKFFVLIHCFFSRTNIIHSTKLQQSTSLHVPQNNTAYIILI